MRYILVLCLVWGLALVDARSLQPEDDDTSNDDADDFLQDDPDQGAVASQSVPAGPVSPDSAGPGAQTVSMATSLNRFGKRDDSSAAAPTLATESAAKGADPKAIEQHVLPASQAEADAQNAHIAAKTAKKAAKVANKVAEHSVHITEHAKDALKDAHDALHKARVQSSGLSDGQKQSLKSAEAKLKEATKTAEYGQVKNAKYVKADVDNKALQKAEVKMDALKKDDKKRDDDELEAMKKEIQDLRKQLKKKEGDKAEDDAMLKDLQDELEELQAASKKGDTKDKKSHDELKAEIERLRTQIKNLEDDKGTVTYTIPKQEKDHKLPHPHRHKEVKEQEIKRYDVEMEPLSESSEKVAKRSPVESEVTPVESKGIDIDTAMPYGDLEPFGREDTAQELTESSVRESDAMVDQLERAEVAEEKRSVFRALTRLRGAAITSFDGVARTQTGNIDEYNKVHKWRRTHPLHHLADEESDVSKWAFPDNAD